MQDEKKVFQEAGQEAEQPAEVELMRRRDFLKGLKKWSQAVIGAVALAGLLPAPKVRADWLNRRGGWINGGGGGGWINGGGGGGSWINGGGGWINNRGGGGGWINR